MQVGDSIIFASVSLYPDNKCHYCFGGFDETNPEDRDNIEAMQPYRDRKAQGEDVQVDCSESIGSMIVLSCGHVEHGECLEKAVRQLEPQQDLTCPSCRKVVDMRLFPPLPLPSLFTVMKEAFGDQYDWSLGQERPVSAAICSAATPVLTLAYGGYLAATNTGTTEDLVGQAALRTIVIVGVVLAPTEPLNQVRPLRHLAAAVLGGVAAVQAAANHGINRLQHMTDPR